jgi:AraC-like DNA-binding protein
MLRPYGDQEAIAQIFPTELLDGDHAARRDDPADYILLLWHHEILQQLKASLASRYLEEGGMPISKIAWLLGFEEASSFSHACRRWLGKSPRELRSAATALA